MKKSTWIWVIIGIIVVLLVWAIYAASSGDQTANLPPSNGTGTPAASPTPAFDQSISDGTITVSYPSADFGLATTASQILVKSYIPPCDSNFNYCIYLTNTTYQGTNFESAGIRIEKRTDLATQTKCLTAQPAGFTGLTPITATSSDYATAVFPQVGGAAAGHFASGSLYRLFYSGSCYEFETRIGQSDFLNYPSGTIQQFTSADQDAVQAELTQILGTLKLSSGEQVAFPTPSPASSPTPSM